jgi:protein transport protein SEC24
VARSPFWSAPTPAHLRLLTPRQAGRGGHVLALPSAACDTGPGALPPAAEPGDTEPPPLAPRDRFWNDLGEDAAEDGVGLTLFLGLATFGDVAALGARPAPPARVRAVLME